MAKASTVTEPQAPAATTDSAAMNLYQKLAAITGDVGKIAKGGKNTEQNYSYIEYAAVAGALRTLFADYHVMCIPTMGERTETEIRTAAGKIGYHVLTKFTFKFVNADNPDEVEMVEWVGEAIDYSDKATNKAATAALKYCLMRTFNISEKNEEDADQHSPEAGERTPRNTIADPDSPATPKQKGLIATKLKQIGVPDEDMQGYLIEQYGLVDTERMTKGDASKIIEALLS